jgi:2-polyprenyl-6-methoxyphenol hydroxylase-like FAD-dependent oxidoreductase
MAGLCAAAALADSYDRVTVLDRDRLPEQAANRKGTPQDRHIHLLLAAGAQALSSLFPGVLDELAATGVRTVLPERARLAFGGHRFARVPAGQSAQAALGASRPLLEAHIRARLRACAGVEVRDGMRAYGLTTTPDGRRVTGVRVQDPSGDGPEETVPADLVVDCAGRRSRAPAWLEELGFAAPPQEQLAVDVSYATRHYRLPEGALDSDGLVTIGPTPDGPRGGVMLGIEDDRWVATLFGLCGARPPLEAASFDSFAAELPFADLHEALMVGKALDDPAGYRFPANVRRRYDRLTDLPAGLLVAGDAVCSFNPIYGQGMTIGALEAVTLRDLLRDGGAPSAKRWFDAITPTIDTAWQLAVGADLAVRCVPGRRPLAGRLQQAYVRRIQAAARHEPAVAEQFLRVAGHLDPPSGLTRPAVLARVLRGHLRRQPPG